jgi:hypothetical protein
VERAVWRPSSRSQGRLVSTYLPHDCVWMWWVAEIWITPSIVWYVWNKRTATDLWPRMTTVQKSWIYYKWFFLFIVLSRWYFGANWGDRAFDSDEYFLNCLLWWGSLSAH